MNYQFVQWSNNIAISGDKLNAMSENDEYLYDSASRAPRGVLLYIRKNSPYSLSGASGTLSGFTGSFSPRKDSLLKCSLYIPNVDTTDFNQADTKLDVKFNSVTVASTYLSVFGVRYTSSWTSPSQLDFLYESTSSSSINVTVGFAISTGTPTIEICRGMTLIIQDYGNL
jgi:hypothetical protein